MINLFKAARVRAWIVGLAPFPAAPTGEGEPGALADSRHELEEIGERYNCWRLSARESDRDFAFKIAVEICSRLNELDADLDRVINYDKARGSCGSS